MQDRIESEMRGGLPSETFALFRDLLRASRIHDPAYSLDYAACLSSARDDLNQWRGYGGGECGYAIVFRALDLAEICSKRKETSLYQICYNEGYRKRVVDETLNLALSLFNRTFKDSFERDLIIQNIANDVRETITMLSGFTKHPGFRAEQEFRVSTVVRSDEMRSIVLRQKRTLLARHFPLDLRDTSGKLPIARICVGPSPAQSVTRESVLDLLAKCEYSGIEVELSKLPYRVP